MIYQTYTGIYLHFFQKRKGLFFEIPLTNDGLKGENKGLAMSERGDREEEGGLWHKSTYYLDYAWIRNGSYQQMQLLNDDSLPGMPFYK